MNNNNQRGSKARVAIILVTFLFFAWGLTMNLVNALNTPMANYMEFSATKASLLQVAYFGAYFFLAIPAATVAKNKGYKVGMMMGLSLFVVGSLLTIPATSKMSYSLFLVAMFITASGAATLETNCNPYITKLGDPSKEAFRLNLAQSFNGIGNIVGPVILGSIIGDTITPGQPGFEVARETFFSGTRIIYIGIAVALAIVLGIFFAVELPTPPGDEEVDGSDKKSNLFAKPHFKHGIIAAFVFIGLQVGGMALFSAYSLEFWDGMTAGTATKYLGILSLLFTIGRFITTPLMNKFKANDILGVYMSITAALMVIVALGLGKISVIAFMIAYLFISIGFPTIYSLALTDLRGNDAKSGASALTMSIVGAAIIPFILSLIGDKFSLQAAMAATVVGFMYCAWYGFKGSRIGVE